MQATAPSCSRPAGTLVRLAISPQHAQARLASAEPAGWLTRAFKRKDMHHAEATSQNFIAIVLGRQLNPYAESKPWISFMVWHRFDTRKEDEGEGARSAELFRTKVISTSSDRMGESGHGSRVVTGPPPEERASMASPDLFGGHMTCASYISMNLDKGGLAAIRLSYNTLLFLRNLALSAIRSNEEQGLLTTRGS
ncbi:uncharacterized protein BDR25DRAFT_357618 [Lindgomyces ingoldianus]|uniref:Uncharacterized protein n=1 Tax=Lindgomyces ingoldianus TaxID=673940 RepID=A0ACB6QQF7_9PLEO|nr:uncharacterized protein BDR25DRAFT_357618 [Lindgomyces ingoldianus]KAF2468322.1 hypothetical protein BDR25DRAFT_357618 [Lindgomyces ingoldianus]